MVVVLYFAACRVATEMEREELADVAGLPVAAIVAQLCQRHPKLGALAPHCRIALNRAFVDDDTIVPEGAEFAMIPPVAGG